MDVFKEFCAKKENKWAVVNRGNWVKSTHLKMFLLVLQRAEGRGIKIERNIDVSERQQLVAFCKHPDQRSNVQPGCVP